MIEEVQGRPLLLMGDFIYPDINWSHHCRDNLVKLSDLLTVWKITFGSPLFCNPLPSFIWTTLFDVRTPRSEDRNLIIRVITFEVTQPIYAHCTSTSQTDVAIYILWLFNSSDHGFM